jgi:predicted metal-binding membrane protein
VAPEWFTLGAFTLGWLVMITAMMLPTLLPTLRSVGRLASRPGRAMAATALGYTVVWLLIGVAARASDGALHLVVDHTLLATHQWLVTVALLLIGGLLQASRYTRRAADRCRSYRSIVISGWHGTSHLSDAWSIGVVYGVSCATCCITLVGTMMAIGMAHVGWMVVLGALMAVFKSQRFGAFVGWAVAASCLAGATVVAIGH